MKSVFLTLILASALSLLAAFTPGSASAGDHGYYGGGYYGEGYAVGGYGGGCCGRVFSGGCCRGGGYGRGLFTSPPVYAAPVYVVPAQPVYVAPARRVYVNDYGYRRRGYVRYETNRYYRPRHYGY